MTAAQCDVEGFVMSLDDAETYELTRRRLEEEVRKKVEADLFRYYRNLGSIIIAVFGGLIITVGWPFLLERIDGQIATQVSEPVKKARETAEKANSIANGILLRLEDKQEHLNQSIGRLGGKFDEMHVRYGEASAQIETTEEQVREIRQLTEFFKGRVQANPVSREEIQQLEERLAEVISQTGVLASAISALGSGAPERQPAVEAAEEKLKDIYAIQTEAMNVAQVAAAKPRNRATVYVQFAGGKREDIESISETLRDAGWTVPGEERIGTAAGKHEVRYFHDGDAPAARLLADDVNEAIAAAGFAPRDVQAKQVSVKKLPADGILELWLDIPVR